MSEPRSPRAAQARRPGPPPWSAPTRWIVAATLVLAIARFLTLGRYGLWIDEALTLNDAHALSLERLPRFPLSLLLMRGWLSLVGHPIDEFTLRIPAALFGALSLPLSAWTFRPMLGPRRAWIAAFVLGLSSWHWFWSQSARGYTLMLVLSLCGAGMVLRACTFGRPKLYVAGVVCAASAAFAHPTGAFVAAALLFAPTLARRLSKELAWAPRARVCVVIGVLMAAALGRWAVSVWADYSLRKSGSSVGHFLLTSGFYVTAPVALAALWSMVSALRARDGARLTITFVVAIAGLAALVAAALVRVSAQYVFVLAPWIAALAAWTLDDRGPNLRTARVLGAAVVVWGLVDVGAYLTVRHGDRPRWGDAYEYVALTRGADDLVFGMAAPSGAFYLDPGEVNVRTSGALLPLTPFSRSQLEYWIGRERRLWIVLNREDLEAWPASERASLERFLREQCEWRRTFSVGGTPRHLDVEVYVRN